MQAEFTTHQLPKIRALLLRVACGLALTATLAACNASNGDGPLRSAASTVGWATTVPEPKDFVRASRTTTELAYVPTGRLGLNRPVSARTAVGVRDLEAELDRTRDEREASARRALPSGAYGRALPSVARPAASRPTAAPAASGTSPASYPVNPNRLRQLRENSRDATER